MNEVAEQLKCQLEQLPLEDRAELAHFLLRSLDDEPELSDAEQQEVDAAWDKEINRRVEEINSGKVKGVPADEVFAKLREKYS